MKNIAVVGCGHGGQALAADFSQRGLRVTICATSEHPGDIQAVQQQQGVYCKGQLKNFAPIYLATTNLQQALKDVDYVFFVVPSYAQERVFIECLPYLKSEQWVITLEANFSSLVFTNLLQRLKINKTINLADISTLPYACRAEKAGTVNILATKQKMGLAAIPDHKTIGLARELEKFFPSTLVPYQSVIEVGLNSLSGILHPAVTLLNAGRIPDSFYFYREGITPQIANLLEVLDQERRHIGMLLGYNLPYCMKIEEEFYGIAYKTIYDFYSKSQIHSGTYKLNPTSLTDRYISQDIPYVVVPWYEIGLLMGYEAKVMRNLIDLASILNERDYLAEGRNAAHMNIINKNLIDQYARTGVSTYQSITHRYDTSYLSQGLSEVRAICG